MQYEWHCLPHAYCTNTHAHNDLEQLDLSIANTHTHLCIRSPILQWDPLVNIYNLNWSLSHCCPLWFEWNCISLPSIFTFNIPRKTFYANLRKISSVSFWCRFWFSWRYDFHKTKRFECLHYVNTATKTHNVFEHCRWLRFSCKHSKTQRHWMNMVLATVQRANHFPSFMCEMQKRNKLNRNINYSTCHWFHRIRHKLCVF